LDLAWAVIPNPLSLQSCSFTDAPDLQAAQLRSVSHKGSALPALNADGMEVKGDASLDEGFTATGEVRLLDTTIGEELSLSRATLTNQGGPALGADGMEVKAGAFLDEGFTATGEVRLVGATIGGELNLRGRASLTNEGGPALNADGMEVRGSAFLDEGFTATGEVRLLGATIGGQLSLRRATLTSEGGPALTADFMEVRGSAFLDEGFTATGEVRLLDTTIGGELNLRGATLTKKNGPALSADRMEVKADAFLDEGFTATGEVRLPGTTIGGELNLRRATLTNEGGSSLNFESGRCRSLAFNNLTQRPRGTVNLTGTQVGALIDDETSWPQGGSLLLAGFVYGSISDLGIARRLEWLRLQPHFLPGPYEQLARLYREEGQDDLARQVSMERERARAENLGWPGRLWNAFLGLTVGYGYRPRRAFAWLIILFLASSIVFLFAARQGVMVATDAQVRPRPSAVHCQASYPCFSPFLYAADLLLPFVGFHQEDSWRPDASVHWGQAYRVATWLTRIGGLALVAALGAGGTRVLRRP